MKKKLRCWCQVADVQSHTWEGGASASKSRYSFQLQPQSGMSISEGVSSGHMMSSTFSPSSYLGFTLSPPAGHFLYPSGTDPYEGHLRGPGLLPYMALFHHHGHLGLNECPLEPAFIQKRNERERQRVRCVNQGYAKLKDHLPGKSTNKRLSKVETLRAAIKYIQYLQGLQDHSGPPLRPDCEGQSEGVHSEDLVN